jgi:hypothetical protein
MTTPKIHLQEAISLSRIYTKCGRFVVVDKTTTEKSKVTCYACLEIASAPIRKAMKRS